LLSGNDVGIGSVGEERLELVEEVGSRVEERRDLGVDLM
jgi:hypothetical protein